MFRVKYYTNTKEYFQQLTIQRNELHLVQSAALAHHVKEKGEGNVLAHKNFMKKIFPTWHSSLLDIYLQSKIREYIRKNASGNEAKRYEHTMKDLIESFRYVVELRVTKLLANQTSQKNQLFFVGLVDYLLADTIVKSSIEDITGLTKANVQTRTKIANIEHIYVHHYDYIDAPRMMLFSTLQKLGIEVTFCIPYHPAYEKLYSPWKAMYSPIQKAENWTEIRLHPPTKGSTFAHYIDEKIPTSAQDTVSLHLMNFKNPTHFKDYIQGESVLDSHHVVAVYDEDLNMYTNLVKTSHFYATKYGQFFLHLTNCQKTAEGIQLSYATFVNIMTSGWIRSNTTLGEQALTLLIDLEEYMQGVRSIQEILERLHALDELREWSDLFDDTAKFQTENRYVKKYMTNPFRAFSFIHPDRYHITVKQLIDCTKDVARKVNRLLIAENETRTIHDYVKDIEIVYMSVREHWKQADATIEMMDAFLKQSANLTWPLEKREMAAFLALTFGKQERDDEEQGIAHFTQLIGKALQNKPIHVTGLSLHTFPRKNPQMPTFLDHTWLKKCVQRTFVSENKRQRIEALLVDYYSRENAQQMDIYTLYHLLAYAEKEVTLSYIENLQAKDGPSIYLSVLEELYHQTTTDESMAYEIDFEEELHEEETLDGTVLEEIPDLIWLDKDFCYKKFLLDAVVEHHPIYESDFHHQILFSSIGTLLSEQGNGREQVEDILFPMFPQWTNTLKRNLIDTNNTTGLRNYKSYRNVHYPKAMQFIETLRSSYTVTKRSKVKNQYNDDTFQAKEHIKDLQKNGVQGESGAYCRMCPYLHVCVEGAYPVDDTY